MASRGLCSLDESLGDSELTSEAARLLFAEEPTEPDLQRASIEAAREHVRSTWCSSDPYEDSASSSLPDCSGRMPTPGATDGS
jgi:hypothetical protein